MSYSGDIKQDPNSLQCTICGPESFTYGRRGVLNENISIKHTGGPPQQHICEICNEVFTDKRSLNRHIRAGICERNERFYSPITPDPNPLTWPMEPERSRPHSAQPPSRLDPSGPSQSQPDPNPSAWEPERLSLNLRSLLVDLIQVGQVTTRRWKLC